MAGAAVGPRNAIHDLIESRYNEYLASMNLARLDDNFVDGSPAYSDFYETVTIRCGIAKQWLRGYPLTGHKAQVVLFFWSPHVTMAKEIHGWANGNGQTKLLLWQVERTLDFLDYAYRTLIYEETRKHVRDALIAVHPGVYQHFVHPSGLISLGPHAELLFNGGITVNDIFNDFLAPFSMSYPRHEHF